VQAGLDPCWSQTHYVGFVMTWLNYKPFTFVAFMTGPFKQLEDAFFFYIERK
jgi:hypothetical protein